MPNPRCQIPGLYAQRLHYANYALIKEYTVNHIRDPYYNLRYIPLIKG